MGTRTDSPPPRLAERERDPRPLTLVLVALALIATAVALLLLSRRMQLTQGLINHPTSFSGPLPTPAASLPEPVVVTDLQTILTSNDPSALQGREATLLNVRVQSVPGDYAFWVGPSADQQIPVVLRGELTARQSEVQTRIRAGQTVRVFGVIRLVKGAIVFDQDRLLSPEQKERIEGQSVYVDASRVEVVSAARSGSVGNR